MEASVFYLLAYSITLLAALELLLCYPRGKRMQTIWTSTRAFLAKSFNGFSITVALLSLAGIPITAGFIGKVLCIDIRCAGGLMAAGYHRWWSPAWIGLYHYLRIISTLFGASQPAGEKQKTLNPFFYTAMYAALIVLVLLLFWLGISPALVIDGVRQFLAIEWCNDQRYWRS